MSRRAIGCLVVGIVAARAAEAHAAPTVTVTSPLPGTVTRGSVRVTASCTECTKLLVVRQTLYTSPEKTLADGDTTVDQEVSVDPDGAILHFRAWDAAGGQTDVPIRVFVETSPNLEEVETVPGPIRDVTDDRILYRTDGDSLKLKTRGGADVVTIPGLDQGRLFGTGVLHWLPTGEVAEWKDGKDTPLGSMVGDGTSTERLTIRGDRAGWIQWGGQAGIRTFGKSTEITADQYMSINFARNGDALLAGGNPFGVYRRSPAGVMTQLRDCSGSICRAALSDGDLVVSFRTGSLPSYLSSFIVWPTPESLGTARSTGGGVAVANDWVAFADQEMYYSESNAGPIRLFLRSPTGEKTPLPAELNGGAIEGINSSGDVLVGRNKRYLVRRGGAPIEVSSTSYQTTAMWLSDGLYVVMGRTLFRFREAGAADAGVDAATITDAGSEVASAADATPEASSGLDGSAADVLVAGGDGATADVPPSNADAAIPVDAPTSAAASDDGCGCRIGARPDGWGGLWSLVAGVLLLRRRSSRKRLQSTRER